MDTSITPNYLDILVLIGRLVELDQRIPENVKEEAIETTSSLIDILYDYSGG